MKCRRRNTIARSSISIATTLNSSQAFAVKSADLHDYKQLKTTQKILFTLISPQIVAYKSCDVTIENGIMHGNVKGQNDLVIAQGAKIADFGCALRWWLMVKHYLHDNDLVTVLYRIRFWDEVPKIPNHVSEEEKDFLTKYYKRDPSERGLVEELLVHGFVHAFNEHTDYKLELDGSRNEHCERLLREQMVQERAVEVARGNLEQYYRMINRNYGDFMKRYL
ncbi:mitogen-activated protein kinase kinase kinase 18-like [Arachis hypogaea]|uniref:mitogen-activated protein kinase kinase kinase 18-like n=1 Tax=Arachis hypogaea TaxID=3818 RepID=UPI003B20FB39